MASIPKTIVRRIIAALNFPVKITDFITYSKAIYKAMFNNPGFTASAAKLTTLNTDINTLDASETGCKTKPPSSSVTSRNAAIEVVKADLRSLRSDVQGVADANPAKAEAIINSASMSVKKFSPRGKLLSTATDDVEEGKVDLTGEGSGPHEWRISPDGVTWSLLPASSGGKTVVEHLTPGSVYFFQNRQILTKGRKSDWSQSVKIRVK
jgi:hypothetical protein